MHHDAPITHKTFNTTSRAYPHQPNYQTLTMSNSTSSSTVSLLQTSHSSKNFQQAFGKLSSSFGFGGSVVSAPILPTPSQNQQQKKQKSQPPKATTAPPVKEDSRTAAQRAYWASQSHKNFEAAYGNLAGTYGFGGSAPSPKPRKV